MPSKFVLKLGDSAKVLKDLPSNSVDSICTDPPYHLTNPAGGFLQQSWDANDIAYSIPMWQECLRILKPGGYLASFSSSRTYHRMAVAIEDAGFVIRDQLMWLYSEGMPKSLNIAKTIEEAAGVDLSQFGSWLREQRKRQKIASNDLSIHFTKTGKPSGIVRNWENGYGTPTPAQYNKLVTLLGHPDKCIQETSLTITGYKTTTASANHFVPTADHTTRIKVPIYKYTNPLAQQWEGWGSNLTPAHEPICLAQKPLDGTITSNVLKHGVGGLNIASGGFLVKDKTRLPSNVIHDNSEEIKEAFKQSKPPYANKEAIKFFYAPKVSTEERQLYLTSQNTHTTLKPIALCKYLITLITPKNGTVLDPFAGTATMGVAALLNDFEYIGVELMPEHYALAEERLTNCQTDIAMLP
jgi:DNA modification methylase